MRLGGREGESYCVIPAIKHTKKDAGHEWHSKKKCWAFCGKWRLKALSDNALIWPAHFRSRRAKWGTWGAGASSLANDAPRYTFVSVSRSTSGLSLDRYAAWR